MALGNRFQSQQEQLVSYDFTDIADGTGTNVYYLCVHGNSATTFDYFLTSKVLYSVGTTAFSGIETKQSNAGTTNVDFDLSPFNVPQYPKGTAYFSIAYKIGGAVDCSVSGQIFHYDGTTETALSAEVTSINCNANHGMALIALPITTEKQFKIGEILRLTVKLTVGGGSDGFMAHDPAGRSGAQITTALTNPPVTTSAKLLMPFRLPNI